MNGYKKLIKNPKTRYKILSLLNWVPDKAMLKLQYRIKLHRKLDLKNPTRYTEKLQWYKVYYRDPVMRQCVDKYEVREYVKACGCEEILNECYGVYSSPDEIDFDSLPNSFVIKDTLGGGGTSVILVKDKSTLDIEETKNKLAEWCSFPTSKKNYGREWVYDGLQHRIIIEKLLINESSDDLPDYKFFCFNGNAFCSYMMENYTFHHEQGVMGFLDRDFNLLPAHRVDFAPMVNQPAKPENYEKMLEIAEKLSEKFPHVRVDLYNLSGKIVFGELTFFNASGYTMFAPDSFDIELGEQFILPNANN